MKIGENLKVLLQGIPSDVLREVEELYRIEAAAEALQCEQERAEVGLLNQQEVLPGSGGELVRRVHATDYWAQQVIHKAPGDPDLWRWFAKTPEGEYSRVRRSAPARIVVPAWRGGLWSTVSAAA